MSRTAHTLLLLFLVMAFTLPFGSCYQELVIPETELADKMERIISFDGTPACLDKPAGALLFCIGSESLSSFKPEVSYTDYQSMSWQGKDLKNHAKNDLGSIRTGQAYPLLAHHEQGTDTFWLSFTTFPIASLLTEEAIVDEPKVLSWMELYSTVGGGQPGTRVFKSHAGIEYRGHSSMAYPKKKYGIELWADEYEKDRSASLLGMRYGEDWILDAMWTDKLRMRNKLSFEVWQHMASVPDEDLMPDLVPTVHYEYVELFINNRYEGLYCLGERMDKEILEFSSSQYDRGGAIYEATAWASGSTIFSSYHSEPGLSELWDGWQLIYPDHTFYWDPLAHLRKTIVRASDKDFAASIGSMIDLENVADHYILLNLLLAQDNVGKNNFLARYTDKSRFFFIPWDLDYTWGRRWEILDSGPEGAARNNLHQRLIDNNVEGFNELVKTRWKEYRADFLHRDTLISMVDTHYGALVESGAIPRENRRWEEARIDLAYEYDYITSWIDQRLVILDLWFEEH